MLLGYVVAGKKSNDGDFFKKNEPENLICSQCGTCLDFDYAPQEIDIKPTMKDDVSYTDDLRTLFSEKFVKFCKETLKSDDAFIPIKAGNRTLYYLNPTRVLNFDVIRREVKFEGECSRCGGYETIAGAYPVFLKTQEPIGPGFYKTDTIFASGKSKHPLTIVGTEWMKLIADQKFKGINLEKISDTWPITQ